MCRGHRNQDTKPSDVQRGISPEHLLQAVGSPKERRDGGGGARLLGANRRVEAHRLRVVLAEGRIPGAVPLPLPEGPVEIHELAQGVPAAIAGLAYGHVLGQGGHNIALLEVRISTGG